jgi:hypothetical protein
MDAGVGVRVETSECPPPMFLRKIIKTNALSHELRKDIILWHLARFLCS